MLTRILIRAIEIPSRLLAVHDICSHLQLRPNVFFGPKRALMLSSLEDNNRGSQQRASVCHLALPLLQV